MRGPVDVVRGRIVDYDPTTSEVIIRAKYEDLYTYIKRGYKDCNIQMIDSRTISDKQRRCCYSLLRAISEYTGAGMAATKVWAKRRFAEDELHQPDMDFSLADAPMSLVAAFQAFLIRTIVEQEVPCDFPLLRYVDDVPDYLYACTLKKVCCICGKPSDLHHVDAVGAGNDREDIIHEGLRVLPLCREHHMEAHQIGKYTFRDKYHLTDGVVLDKALCQLYGLKYEVK